MREVCVLLILLISTHIFFGQNVNLPDEIRGEMDRAYPGWRLSTVDEDIVEFLRERSSGSQPNLISGDFDGDGRLDYAILIEHTNFHEPDKAFTHVLEKLVFLKRRKGYKKLVMEERQPADSILYMTLAKKGATGRNFISGKSFTYPTDSIRISYFEKASGTYIYRNGKFRHIIEVD